MRDNARPSAAATSSSFLRKPTTSGVPTPNKPPSDPINMCRPVDDVVPGCAGRRGAYFEGEARKAVFLDNWIGVDRKQVTLRGTVDNPRRTTSHKAILLCTTSLGILCSFGIRPAWKEESIGTRGDKRTVYRNRYSVLVFLVIRRCCFLAFHKDQGTQGSQDFRTSLLSSRNYSIVLLRTNRLSDTILHADG